MCPKELLGLGIYVSQSAGIGQGPLQRQNLQNYPTFYDIKQKSDSIITQTPSEVHTSFLSNTAENNVCVAPDISHLKLLFLI